MSNLPHQLTEQDVVDFAWGAEQLGLDVDRELLAEYTPDEDFACTRDDLSAFDGYRECGRRELVEAPSGRACLLLGEVQPFKGDRRRSVVVIDRGNDRVAVTCW